MAKNKKRRKIKNSQKQLSPEALQARRAERKFKPLVFGLVIALMIGGLIIYNLSFKPNAGI